MNLEREKQTAPSKYELVIGVGGAIIVFSAVGLSFFLLSYFGIDLKKMSFFLSFRTLLTIGFSIIMFPTILFVEYVYKVSKKRRFSWKDVIVGVGILGILLVVALPLLTLLDVVFSDLDVVWQIPLAVGCTSLGVIADALVVGNRRFKKFAREQLGW
jgi:hypothetical protein